MRSGVALSIVLAALVSAAGCDAASQSECHRRAVDRLGCCPACDAECRATVSQECAELHDEPLSRLDDEAESTGTSEGVEHGAPDEPAPQ